MSRLSAILWCAVALCCIPALSAAQPNPTRTVTNADIVGDVIWSADTTYIMNGLVFVDSLETLTIEAGTVIKGKDDPITALVVSRGGKIYAEGTKQNPIIFTAEGDDVDDPDDIPLDSDLGRGLWGGVIILGQATINVAGGQNNIEGIDPTDPRGLYGGNDDADDSGVFRYVSIRHGGVDIGADNEINGLTMGGVGSGTTIEHVEVFFNKDDGFEWFGGTVNTRYLVSAFCGDDAFDYDEGFRGYHQFWFSIQPDNNGDHGGEHDGGTEPEDGQPYAMPTIYNATYLGSGATSTSGKANNALIFRDNAGGKYYNSLFHDFKGIMLTIEDLDAGADSKARLDAGELAFEHNIVGSFGGGTTAAQLGAGTHEATVLSDATNRITDPKLRSISRTTDGGLDPRPLSDSPALTDAMTPPDNGFYTETGYIGAFGVNNLWIDGWTALAEMGYLREPVPITDRPTRTVTNADIVGDVIWSADTTYIMNGLVFVDSLETLTIEPGTVIKGVDDPITALVVSRGGKIYAEGTKQNPIIFTAEGDDVDDPDDIPLDSDLGRGLWGGVIILGQATINVAGGQNNIEGIDPTDPRGLYGGNDDADDSGVFRYVSIRHGGVDIGADNEINGLTMGGVGSGTTIEHVEVFFNKDDGFEWFGGTVNTRYLVSAFCGDDAFDYDEGFRGYHQFWFSIQPDNNGDHGGEHDGGTEPEDGQPYAMPTIYNATYLGSGATSTSGKANNALIFRDNAGGKYYNSLFHDFKGIMLTIEDLDAGADSKARLDAGELAFEHNIVGSFGGGTTAAQLGAGTHEATVLSDATNRITDPKLRSISRTTDGGLDPRPLSDSPALTDAMTPPDNGFYTETGYIGAFGVNNLWIDGWTALAGLGYTPLVPLTVSAETTDSDTATVKFALVGGGQTQLKFKSGTTAGANVTFMAFGNVRPADIATDPQVSGGQPVMFFDIDTDIADGTSFEAEVTVTYTDEQLAAAGVVHEDSLKLFRYDDDNDLWVQLPTTVDRIRNIATATTTAFSTWSLGPAATSGVTEETVTGNVPKVFTLGQNAPNPFNPSTRISYAVPRTGKIRLVVYNLLGQQVETLVDGVKAAGTYTVTWDAQHLASGLYFYRLEASVDGQTAKVVTKKMTLLK